MITKEDFMQNLRKGEKLIIHSYKHNGCIHRAWDEAIFIEETPDYLVFGNDKTRVTESDGRKWKTKEPAIIYFFKNSWFNIIGQLKNNGIYYYCNIASPYIIEEGAIKYIDYDLDLRVFPDKSYKILDKGEYKYHKSKMKYSDELDKILTSELNKLIELNKNNHEIFDHDKLLEYHKMYEELTH
ncbi:MAG: DUF402 domain-containing protein [Bacilli bacterium]|nr:DUF402 domain-containing protein [Bacilli bacterium]